MTKEISVTHNQEYKAFLTSIKQRLNSAQMRAALAANSELIKFYWELGRELIQKQKAYKWGTKFLEQFSDDMRYEFPEMQGFSVTNLKRMRLFAQKYRDFLISPQPVDQLPWGHLSLLIHQIKSQAERHWYAEQALVNGWSCALANKSVS